MHPASGAHATAPSGRPGSSLRGRCCAPVAGSPPDRMCRAGNPRLIRERFAIVCLAILLACLGATPARADGQINQMCPVMTDEPADPAITWEYEGKTIAFCCSRCVQKFRDDPRRYLARLPQFGGSGAMIASAAQDPVGAGPEVQGKSIWGQLHPAIVHFPIAGLPLALLGWILATWTQKPEFALADLPPLFVAALGAGCAYLTGTAAAAGAQFSPRLHDIAERHESAGTIVLVVSLLLLALRLWHRHGLRGAWRWVYGGGLLIASGIAGAAGYLGGCLVFGPDHLRL